MTRSAHPGRCATALLALAVLAGCAQFGQSTGAGEHWSSTRIAGLEVTDGESGPRPGAPVSRLAVANSDGGEMDRLAAGALDDGQRYWREQFPPAFGREFAPVNRLVSYDSRAAGITLCGTDTAGLVNALYCAADDTIAWDRGELLPLLAESFGPMSVVAVLAHELGHAVQFRLGAAAGIDQFTSSIVKEQQADCFTGAFFRWVSEGNAPHFQVSTGPGLNQVLRTLFFIRDSAGTSFDSEGAHGSAFDRVSAFQIGFGDGPARCARIDQAEIQRRITQQAFGEQDRDSGLGEGNLRVDDRESLSLLQATLNGAFARTGAPAPRIVLGPDGCTGGVRTTPATYCPDTNTVSIDVAALARIGAPPGSDGGGIGDFAAFAEVASRYALSVQQATGYPLDGFVAGQRTACLTGQWAGTIVAGAGAALQLSPGDLDEAVAEMLAPESLIAADQEGRSVPSGFARVQAFRDGFTAPDAEICTSKYR